MFLLVYTSSLGFQVWIINNSVIAVTKIFTRSPIRGAFFLVKTVNILFVIVTFKYFRNNNEKVFSKNTNVWRISIRIPWVRNFLICSYPYFQPLNKAVSPILVYNYCFNFFLDSLWFTFHQLFPFLLYF